ncbi:FeoA family protein [Negadavirga shengliensis]|uniref:Ferrous iron transport protein A n=1 Tax=Negadavirga shengliensis TaxID=1389218 RepID=A0ABV9SYD3_9BACT
MTADQLHLDEEKIIDSVNESPISINFLEMGILPGKTIKLISKAPFSGPKAFLIGGSIIALRRSEAVLIQLKL